MSSNFRNFTDAVARRLIDWLSLLNHQHCERYSSVVLENFVKLTVIAITRFFHPHHAFVSAQKMFLKYQKQESKEINFGSLSLELHALLSQSSSKPKWKTIEITRREDVFACTRFILCCERYYYVFLFLIFLSHNETVHNIPPWKSNLCFNKKFHCSYGGVYSIFPYILIFTGDCLCVTCLLGST